MKAIWDYIHGFARRDNPELITFYDHHDQCLYREVELQTVGSHGWELVNVMLAPDPANSELRYEYFFKRNRAEGYTEGAARTKKN